MPWPPRMWRWYASARLRKRTATWASISFGAPLLATVVSNPEFLREGAAVRDFMEPSLLVVGGASPEAVERVAAIYSALPVKASIVALRTAELIKYACNAFHAVKI